MAQHQITWTKEQRQRAVKNGKALLGVGIDGNRADSFTGRYEHYGPCDVLTARFVFFFSNDLAQSLEKGGKLTEAKLRKIFENQVAAFKAKGRLK